MPDPETRGTAPTTVAGNTERAGNDAMRRLLREWLADESGYDEATWIRVKQAMEANRLSDRPRFDG
jgi:hypothetical protein